MLKKDARVKSKNGFRFFEKDILKDDYIFQGDIDIVLNIDYLNAGFGVVIMDSTDDSETISNNAYLFKVGYKEASVIHSNIFTNNLEKQITFPGVKTITENMEIRLVKSGKKIILYVADEKVYDYYLKNDMTRYSIGYYSNKLNKINTIKIKAASPNKWSINMENTIGGYVKFADDTFILTDCIHNAEIEQQDIELKAGRYYVNYTLEDNTRENDIKVYVHRSKDDRFYNEEKNILRNGSFTLTELEKINLKIVGRDGIIKGIAISQIKDDDYVSTNDESVNFDGSHLSIYTSNLKKVTWNGCVSKMPNFILDNNIFDYGVILDNSKTIKPEDTGIAFGNNEDKFYNYEFDVVSHEFKIMKNKELIFSDIMKDVINKITIFKNLSARISELVIYKKNGEIINVNIQDETKQFIPATIKSPIIITDEYDYPFNISSSYRKSYSEEGERYLFTNWEREIFGPQRSVKLENQISKNQDSLIIYGIKKGYKVDLEKIYDIKDDNINSIDMFTKNYDVIPKRDVIYFDSSKNEIVFEQSILEKYSYIVIDYLKENSYCINYRYDKQSYEVDVSTSLSKFKTLYNAVDVDSSGIEINEYKSTSISGNTQGYVVLRKGDE